MNIKEQENQLILNLNVEIILSVILWLGFTVFIGERLWSLRKAPPIPLTIGNNVPTIKRDNLEIIRKSVKLVTDADLLPIVRPEPFD